MSELLAGSPRRQRRILVLAGLATALVLVVAAVTAARVPQRDTDDSIQITIRTPYLGQGITEGTQVLLRGVPVGRIDTVASSGAGGVELGIRLRSSRIEGLTDAVAFDYRPQNYFGVTGLNLLPGSGGRPLTNGQRLDRRAQGNFTMSAMLTRSSQIVNGVLTDRMVDVIGRMANYTTALAPLIEAGFITANAIAEMQRSTPDVQLRAVNDILDPAPKFLDDAITAESAMWGMPSAQSVVHEFGPMETTMQLIATGFFGPVGTLLGSHAADFTPLTEIIRTLSEVVSASMRKAQFMPQLNAVLTGLESAYTGPEGDKSLKVRLAVESIPVLATGLQLPEGR
ncbi:MlaD family protein [Nocardia sp. CA-128927]|uniref:MlaD family protein n=1 Tax=Nocardia sp. CA-128927 TaxID=3239975 RepID=UPI003D98B183